MAGKYIGFSQLRTVAPGFQVLLFTGVAGRKKLRYVRTVVERPAFFTDHIAGLVYDLKRDIDAGFQ